MTKTEALRLARAKKGKAAFVEENKHALDPQTREIVRAELERHKAARPVPPPEVIAYNKRLHEWNTQKQNLSGRLFGRRCRILVYLGFANEIIGQGDTWEEAAKQAKLIPEG